MSTQTANDSATASVRETLAPFAIACGIGAIASVVELLVLAFRRFVLHDFILTGAHVIWLAPLSYLLLFACIGAVVLAASLVLPRRFRAPLAVFVPVAAAVFSILWMFYPHLSRGAILLLAAGVAVQLARTFAPRVVRLRALLQRAAIASVLAIPLLFLAVHGGRFLSQRLTLRELPVAEAGLPNIILIVLDTVRAMSMSLYGFDLPTTPRLEAFARDATLFEHAFAPAPWTLPTHATLFTGHYPHETTAGFRRPLDDSHATLAEVLAAHGYATGGFIANNIYASRETGLARGFHVYEDYRITVGELVISSAIGWFLADNPRVRRLFGHQDLIGRKHAGIITHDALRWTRHVNGRPFFAFLNYFDAHEPFLPPAEIATAFGVQSDGQWSYTTINKRTRVHAGRRSMDDAALAEYRASYHAGLTFIDQQIGVLLDSLRARGTLDNTIVVVTSDHGEMLGEHDLFGHAQTLYTELLHVPLIVRYPARVQPGVRVADYVSLRDLPQTILSLAGIADEPIPGQPLLPSAGGAHSLPLAVIERSKWALTQNPAHYPVAGGTMWSVLERPYQYIARADGTRLLFDIERDPAQVNDLISSGGVDPRTVARMKAIIDSVSGLSPRAHAATMPANRLVRR